MRRKVKDSAILVSTITSRAAAMPDPQRQPDERCCAGG
jgi:hypothetical protein